MLENKDIDRHIKQIEIELENNRKLDDLMEFGKDNLTDSEKEFIMEKKKRNLPGPKKLVMLNVNHCDFCFNIDNRTTTRQLYLNYGFQICKDCQLLKKDEVASIKYIRKHRSFGLFDLKRWFPEDHYFNKCDDVYISRTNGTIEKWKLSYTSAIKITDNGLVFVVHNGNNANKKVSLTQLALLNPELYSCKNKILEKIKSILS
tara:strand:+ start:20 stop:628 length:609 start_codon:yes stop_codon:yes gene_type:complete